jgi:23S rRNA pseudouridine2457 synthase
LQHRLTDPKFEHPRTYWVQVEGIPDAPALRRLEAGVTIQDCRTKPAKARLLGQEPALPPRNPPIRVRKNIPTAWMEITLTEGRNRQVRRMTAAVGYPTLRLVRVRIGPLSLEGLQPGQWRHLTAAEVNRLRLY